MSKDIKKALEHCVEWKCDNCPNRDELGSGEIVCRGRLLPEVLEYVSDLEAKLAESEKKAYSRGHSQRDIANEIKLNALREDVANKEKRIVELKQQLEEKEKEIISLECVISEIHNDIKELHEFKVGEDEYDLTDSDARFSLECELLNKHQDKISFTIDELEKVKDYFIEGYAVCKKFSDFYWNFTEQIDNQIKQLRKGK